MQSCHLSKTLKYRTYSGSFDTILFTKSFHMYFFAVWMTLVFIYNAKTLNLKVQHDGFKAAKINGWSEFDHMVNLVTYK